MSGARPDTWMPIYWGDYARDTGDLGAALHGAYLMLIKHYWCTGAPLPDDDAALWRIATCDSIGHWRKMKPTLSRFFSIRDGLWRHKRVDAELEKAANFIRRQTQNGLRGGRPRKPEETQTESQAKPTGNPTLNPDHNPQETTSHPPSPSPSPTNDVAASSAKPADPILAEAREIIAAYGRAVMEVWDLPTKPIPRHGAKGDLEMAKAWATIGATADLCLDVFGPELKGKRERDGEVPGGMIYLDNPVRRMLAARGISGPVEPENPLKTARAKLYLAALEAYRRGGRQGDPPDHAAYMRGDFDPPDNWEIPKVCDRRPAA